ncbi:MAG: DUF4147 domain-containing protein [Phycisphaeraceae bacterium]|nr:DUF4147 domain-containing protein [Phycisphaeraceae bacterium]
MIIRNRDELLAHGNVRGRTLALDILERALQRVDARALIRQTVRLEANVLTVADQGYPLAGIENIYALGAGKGVYHFAGALEELLGDRIREGLLIEKHLGAMDQAREKIRHLQRIRVHEAGHPIPDAAAIDGAQQLLQLADRARANDLVFVCVVGGCSSLTTLPADGLSLQDIQLATQHLMRCGADVEILDALRTATTQLQGGQLARHIHPARIVNLVVDDDIWRYPRGWEQGQDEAGWGPSAPVKRVDHLRLSTLAQTLKHRDLWQGLPGAVRSHLEGDGSGRDALTADHFRELGVRWQTVVMADPRTSAEAARDAAREMGLAAEILLTTMEGDAAQAGITAAAVAKEIVRSGRPVARPGAVIITGETTVRLGSEHGQGGPNQECVVSAATCLENAANIVIASVGTDGTDGPTDIAGGIVDGQTLPRARELDINLIGELARHNSSHVLRTLSDAVYFAEPGTNLCDLTVIVVAD